MEGSVAGGISASVQSNATVKSCSFSGTIRATVTTARAIGGIIADLESGTVDSCEVISGSTITASSRTNAGGIVGEMSGGYVTNCTVDATIIGATYIDTTRIGGIIGYMESSASQSNVSGNKWPAAYAQIGNDANSGSGGSDTIVPDTDTPTVPDAVDPTVAPEDAATTVDANGNMVAAAGQQIANGFTGVNGASVISSLLNSATAVEMATAAEVAGALGISEYEVGNATNGYKAIGWKFPDSAARPAVNTPIFVITRLGTTNHVGFGYVPHRRAGFENILAIKFDLFRDPSNTSNYMTVEAGENTVAATDSTGETSSSSEAIDETAEDTDSAEPIAAGARALNGMIFVTADGTAFAVKTDGTVPLQGQTVYGAAVPVVSNGGGSDSWENAYIINTVEDLKQMRDRVNAGTESGKYYKLAADLDLTAETDWEGIDLNGYFDGQNHTIKVNIIRESDWDVGLFGDTMSPGASDDVVVKNLNVEENITAYWGAGVIDHLVSGTVDNCTFKGTINSVHAGGIVHYTGLDSSNGATIQNCTADVTIQTVSNDSYIFGGIVAELFEGGSVKNCTVSDSSTITSNSSAYGYIGGIVGLMADEANVSGNRWPSRYPQIGSYDDYSGGAPGSGASDGNTRFEQIVRSQDLIGEVSGNDEASDDVAGLPTITLERVDITPAMRATILEMFASRDISASEIFSPFDEAAGASIADYPAQLSILTLT